MKFDKESKSRIFFFGFFFFLGGGGGGGGVVSWHMNMTATIFFIHNILSHCHDLFYKTVLTQENIPNGIQNREHCSCNHLGKITQKV